MAISTSKLYKNNLVGVFNAAFGLASPNGGILRIRDSDGGGIPANADATRSGMGDILVSIPLSEVNKLGSPTAGVAAKAGTWQDTSADATGTATWFEIVEHDDDGGVGTDSLNARIQGTVSATGGGGDLQLDSTSITIAQTVTINTVSYTQN